MSGNGARNRLLGGGSTSRINKSHTRTHSYVCDCYSWKYE